jgi:hypothetical protein
MWVEVIPHGDLNGWLTKLSSKRLLTTTGMLRHHRIMFPILSFLSRRGNTLWTSAPMYSAWRQLHDYQSLQHLCSLNSRRICSWANSDNESMMAPTQVWKRDSTSSAISEVSWQWGRWLQLTFFHFFAKTLCVCFVPGGDHLSIACIFHNWKKNRKKVSPPISPFLGGRKVEPFFLTFFGVPTCLWIPVVCRISINSLINI